MHWFLLTLLACTSADETDLGDTDVETDTDTDTDSDTDSDTDADTDSDTDSDTDTDTDSDTDADAVILEIFEDDGVAGGFDSITPTREWAVSIMVPAAGIERFEIPLEPPADGTTLVCEIHGDLDNHPDGNVLGTAKSLATDGTNPVVAIFSPLVEVPAGTYWVVLRVEDGAGSFTNMSHTTSESHQLAYRDVPGEWAAYGKLYDWVHTVYGYPR